MKVLHLLDEIEDIIESSSKFPLTGKTILDGSELMEILKEIRIELPDEIQQAQWIKDERQRILDEASQEAKSIMKEAKVSIEDLIENDEVTIKAQKRAEEILFDAQESAKEIRIGAVEYADGLLEEIQEGLTDMDKIVRGNRKELKTGNPEV